MGVESREWMEPPFQVKRYESHEVSINLDLAVLGTRKGLGRLCIEILDMVGMNFHGRVVLSAALVACTPAM